jgi:phage recombination protein Bet
MSNALIAQSKPDGALTQFNPEQMAVIKGHIAKGCTDIELKYFLSVAERSGLDPFARQIYMIKRKEKQEDGTFKEIAAPQTSIEGYRLIADRSEEYQGQTQAEWCGRDGEWKSVWLESSPPCAARVGIWKKGFREPLYAVALYSDYVQTKDEYVNKSKTGKKIPTKFWQSMPSLMLSKCAESLALRKAFPAKMHGLYTAEEMGQADNAGPLNAESELIDDAPLAGAAPPSEAQPPVKPQATPPKAAQPAANPYKINLDGKQPADPPQAKKEATEAPKKLGWKRQLYNWILTLPDQQRAMEVISRFCALPEDLYSKDWCTVQAVMMELSAAFYVFAPAIDFDGEG